MNDLRFLALSNAQIKRIKSLHRKDGRLLEGLFLVEGTKLVLELLQSGWPVLQGLVTELWLETNSLQSLNGYSSHFQVITKDQMERVSGFTTAPGIIAVGDAHFMPVVPEDSPWLILDGIQDPGNLGTILRTAEWFGFNLILATPSTVEALNPKVVSAAMGSLFRIRPKVLDQQTIFEMLKKNQYELVVSSLDGDGMPKVWPVKTALVIGSESHGVSDFWLNKADLLIKIPSFGKAESLNAAIAFGILAADYRL